MQHHADISVMVEPSLPSRSPPQITPWGRELKPTGAHWSPDSRDVSKLERRSARHQPTSLQADGPFSPLAPWRWSTGAGLDQSSRHTALRQWSHTNSLWAQTKTYSPAILAWGREVTWTSLFKGFPQRRSVELWCDGPIPPSCSWGRATHYLPVFLSVNSLDTLTSGDSWHTHCCNISV